MTSYNPFSWAMGTGSSPAASSSKKRKVDQTEAVEGGMDLAMILTKVNKLQKSNDKIERLLKKLIAEKSEKEEVAEEESEEEEEEEEEEEKPDDLLNASWLSKFEQLKKFKAKHGHCVVARTGHSELGRWVVRQRSENKTGSMSYRAIKVAKLNSLGFDWAPQTTQTPRKKRK